MNLIVNHKLALIFLHSIILNLDLDVWGLNYVNPFKLKLIDDFNI